MGSKPSKLNGSRNDVVKVKKHNSTWRQSNTFNERRDAKKDISNRNRNKGMYDNMQCNEEGSRGNHAYRNNNWSSFTPSSVPEKSIISNSTRPHIQNQDNRYDYNDNVSDHENMETVDAVSNDVVPNNLHARMLRGETYDGESQELNERPFHEEKVKRVPTKAYLRPPKSPDCLIADPDAEGDEYEYM